MAFDKIQQVKNLMKMRSEAKKLQKDLAVITHSEDADGMRIKVSADQKIQYIEINGEENTRLKDLINKAYKEVQKKAAKHMMEQGGGLGGLLGNFGK